MEPRIIKKYPNRRLYDTVLGSYITLEQVKELVLANIDFRVLDVRSKKDITQSTLLQIIAEQEAITPLFSLTVLQNFIRFYDEKSQTLLSQYLEQTLALFIKQKKFFQQQWESSQKLMPALMEMWQLQTHWPPEKEKKNRSHPAKKSPTTNHKK